MTKLISVLLGCILAFSVVACVIAAPKEKIAKSFNEGINSMLYDASKISGIQHTNLDGTNIIYGEN